MSAWPTYVPAPLLDCLAEFFAPLSGCLALVLGALAFLCHAAVAVLGFSNTGSAQESPLRGVFIHAMDLRFSKHATEVAFYHQLRSRRSFWWPVVGLLQVAAQLLVTVYVMFDEEVALVEVSHILYFSLQCLASVAIAALSVGSLVASYRGASWSSELIWLCALALGAVAATLQQPLLRHWLDMATPGACEHIDLDVSVSLLSFFVAIYCHVLPMRCCYLAPLVILSSLSSVLQAFGTSCEGALQAKVLRTVLSLALLLSSYGAAHRCEKMDRERFLQVQMRQEFLRDSCGHKELNQAVMDRDLKVLRSFGCTMAFGLRGDFCICCGSIRAAESHFGMEVLGESIFQFMAGGSEPFTRLCQESRGSRLPRALQVLLRVRGHMTPAVLLLLHHGRGSKEYLVGLKFQDFLDEGAESPLEPEMVHPFAPDAETRRPGDRSEDGSDASMESADSLCYTTSLEVAVRFADAETQGAPSHHSFGTDKCIQTAIVWSAETDTFRCGNCSKPPLPNPAKEEDVLGPFIGAWELQQQYREIAQPFIHHLVIQSDGIFVDALGQKRQIEEDASGELYLLKGRMWLTGETLFREGRSGIVMCFDRAEDHPVFQWPGDQHEEEEEEDQMDTDQEMDSLRILENLVRGTNSNQSHSQNFLS